MKRSILILTTIALLWCVPAAPGAMRLAQNGRTNITVGYAENNDQIQQSAELLADYLGRMTGATFALKAGDKQSRIHVGIAGADDVQQLSKMGPEAHMIRVDGMRIVLAGNSDKAVQNACFDFLTRLGCRWLIPSERWTVVPSRPTLEVEDMVVFTEPDIDFRNIWYAYGPGIDPSREVLTRDYKLWHDANLLGGVSRYKCGHTYPSTVGKHEEAFKAHPEYFAMDEKGNRLEFHRYASLCYSNPDVAKFFIEDKTAELRADKEANPYAYTVSMDPNDGSIACNCEPCKALGNGSDQALYLANQVAAALRPQFPDAVVTFYVYASHRMPPLKVKSEPNINVQVAMGFNKTKYSLHELVTLWRQNVPEVGIRDYLGVMAWDWGLPGRGKASSFAYVRKWIPDFKKWNATSYNAEINCNWGSFGPATYVASRLLWESEADADAIYDDYFTSAFGPAAEIMRSLYHSWSDNGDLTRQNMHEWFDALDQAFKVAASADEGVRGRLIDMAAYLHYVKLYADWESAKQANDRAEGYRALKPLLEFTWRIRTRQVMHAYALQRRLVNSGDTLIRPLEEGWRFNDAEAVWKHPDPHTDAELLAIFKADIADTPADERIVRYSRNFIPSRADSLGNTADGALRGATTWYVYAEDSDPLKFKLNMMGVRYQYELTIEDKAGKVVWETQHTVSGGDRYDREDFTMDVELPKPGLYKAQFKAGEDYRPDWPAQLHVVLEMSQVRHPVFRMYGNSYFYVPEGTKFIMMKTDSRLSLQAPSWRSRRDFTAADEDEKLDCIRVPVGDDAGKIWTLVSQVAGNGYFLNIPQWVAPDPSRLLVPSEVVGK